MINPLKLHLELIEAGLPVIGVSADGRLDWSITPTQSQLDQANTIVTNHDPVDYEKLIRDNSINQAANIPSWAGWTEEQALTWHDTNITTPLNAATTLAQAKAVMVVMAQENRALLRMLVALRNAT